MLSQLPVIAMAFAYRLHVHHAIALVTVAMAAGQFYSYGPPAPLCSGGSATDSWPCAVSPAPNVSIALGAGAGITGCGMACMVDLLCVAYNVVKATEFSTSQTCLLFYDAPTRYAITSGCSFYQSDRYRFPENCSGHLANGHRTNGVYTIFKYNPLRLYNIYCFMARAPWTGSPIDCADLLARGNVVSGVYQLSPQAAVYCDMTTEFGGWTVFQRRMNSSVDFSRNWANYSMGFGDLNGNFWLGNSLISQMVTGRPYSTSLRVEMARSDNTSQFMKHSNFTIGNASNSYALTVGPLLAGNTSETLRSQTGLAFATYDRARLGQQVSSACGGWWFPVPTGSSYPSMWSEPLSCPIPDLNALYPSSQDRQTMQWRSTSDGTKNSTMKFRPE